jgi:aquaporin NIP
VNRPLRLRLLAEAAGTAVLVGIGTGAIVAAAEHGGGSAGLLAVAWFLAVTIPVLGVAWVSGAHLNPAVTLSLATANRFPWREVAPYALAQVAGAFGGSAAVWALLGGGAHLGATVPHGIAALEVVPLECVFTFALSLSVLYLTQPGARRSRRHLLLPGVVVGVSTFVIGPWTGSSLNPARSLAPAVLSGDYTALWAYFVAVPLGALGAAVLVRYAARGPVSGAIAPGT